jgi:hypothetical protein
MGLLLKKKAFWQFIPTLPGGAFWLFHIKGKYIGKINGRFRKTSRKNVVVSL